MRISDWSSDVCSSDLQAVRAIIMEKGRLTNGQAETILAESRQEEVTPEAMTEMLDSVEVNLSQLSELVQRSQNEANHYGDALQAQVKDLAVPEKAGPVMGQHIALTRSMIDQRSEERRVGTAWASTCRSRWWPYQ